jgi:hypothetical protein
MMSPEWKIMKRLRVKMTNDTLILLLLLLLLNV